MNFDPARRARHVLPMVLRAPALHKAHPDRAHLRQLVHRLEPVIDRLRQQLRKLLIIEDLQRATGRDLAHCARMEAVVVVAVAALHKDGRI